MFGADSEDSGKLSNSEPRRFGASFDRRRARRERNLNAHFIYFLFLSSSSLADCEGAKGTDGRDGNKQDIVSN